MQAVQTFELRPTYEDVSPSAAASVEDYVAQVHQMMAVSAIQVRQVQQRWDITA